MELVSYQKVHLVKHLILEVLIIYEPEGVGVDQRVIIKNGIKLQENVNAYPHTD